MLNTQELPYFDAPMTEEPERPLIAEATDDLYGELKRAGYPKMDLIGEIVSEENMSDSFDYVIGHLEDPHQREHYRPKKAAIIKKLTREIISGEFRVLYSDVKEMVVHEGGKVRKVQAPPVVKRIGVHSIMVVVERIATPTFITNTGASIKGRGMHWLYHRVRRAISAMGWSSVYYLQTDYAKYYDNIDQERMQQVVRRYVGDPVLLPMLDCFITMLPKGLSKGLRSSQCFANLYLSDICHKMTTEVGSVSSEGETISQFFCYMDDIVILGTDKKTLWQQYNILNTLSKAAGLTIKPSKAVRPLTEGLDYLGFRQFGTHSLIRKRTKQNAARKLAKVKSRRRRQEIIGSFQGMACHADCIHLFKTLTNRKMKKFSEMGVTYTPADGKKRSPAASCHSATY